MPIFKIDDRVQVIDSFGADVKIGEIVTIVGFDPTYTYKAQDPRGITWVFDECHVGPVNKPATNLKNQLTKAEYMAFIEKTFSEMTTLIKAKNSDYTAGSNDPFANFRQSVDYGVDPLSGVMVRVGDKLQRIKSFTKNGKLEVVNEGVEDAFRDLIGYSLIALGMLSERK